MKVEELRIGNLVNIGEEINKLELVDFVDIYEHKTIWRYEPIELDSYWLTKFGLDDNVMWGGIIVFIEDTKDWIIKNKYGKNIVIGKYVHQLQNLHYAITGYELNVLI